MKIAVLDQYQLSSIEWSMAASHEGPDPLLIPG
jgi:hypothetical protein